MSEVTSLGRGGYTSCALFQGISGIADFYAYLLLQLLGTELSLAKLQSGAVLVALDDAITQRDVSERPT